MIRNKKYGATCPILCFFVAFSYYNSLLMIQILPAVSAYLYEYDDQVGGSDSYYYFNDDDYLDEDDHDYESGKGTCFWNDNGSCDNHNNNDKYANELSSCELVVAPSTIPNAGLGIFSLVPLQPEKLVGFGDMVIPIPNIPSTLPDPFEDYSWSGRIYHGDLHAFAPGLNSLMNSQMSLINVYQYGTSKRIKLKSNNNNKINKVDNQNDSNSDDDDDDDDDDNDNSYYDAQYDSTPFHYLRTVVGTQHSIPEGGELFVIYGDHWFQGRQVFQSLPLGQDYHLADKLVTSFTKLTKNIASIDSSSSSATTTASRMKPPSLNAYYDEYNKDVFQTDWKTDLWEIVQSFPTFDSSPASQSWFKALPAYQELHQVMQLGIRSLYQPQATRSVDTLLNPKVARCIDRIRPGPSSVHSMGAFATRDIPKGTIITASPLLHTIKERFDVRGQVWDSYTQTYRSAVSMSESVTNVDDDDNDDNKNKNLTKRMRSNPNHALVVNYCFGHVDSSLLLCPYGVGINYINHHNQKANVKVQWTPHSQMLQNNTWFFETPQQLVTPVVDSKQNKKNKSQKPTQPPTQQAQQQQKQDHDDSARNNKQESSKKKLKGVPSPSKYNVYNAASANNPNQGNNNNKNQNFYHNNNKKSSSIQQKDLPHWRSQDERRKMQRDAELREKRKTIGSNKDAGKITVNLALDYIATRDIEKGEELFLHYGTAWEQAYIHHYQQSQQQAKEFPTAQEYNNAGSTNILLTEAEQAVYPYPTNLELTCHADIMTATQLLLDTPVEKIWTDNDDNDNYKQRGLDCQVLERQMNTVYEGSVTYAIRIFYQGNWRGRAGIPRNYIRFIEKPGMENAETIRQPFRFPIQLPDELVPDAWRDLVK